MQRFVFVLVALAVVSFAILGGCGAKGGDAGGDAKKTAKALTPKETIDAFAKSFSEGGKKWETAKPLMTKKSQEFFDLLQKVEENEKDGPNIISYEVGEEKIDGEKATVVLKSKEKGRDDKEKDKEETFLLKKEDSAWKIYGIMDDGKEMSFEDEKQLEEMREAVKMMEEMKGEKK